MSKLKVLVSGAGGRVGRELLSICESETAFELAGKMDKNHPAPSSPAADVVIDFSAPEAFEALLGYCLQHKLPLVSGTTGLSESQFEKMKKASSEIPLCWASNMSLGVAFVNRMLKAFGSLEGFDFQIEEIHHRYKKDAPSGTALTLQKTLQSVVDQKLPDPLSLRGGGVFGVHKIWAFSDEEVISLEHQALNRRVFAKGALKAALWLKSKPPGLYTIEDVLQA